VASVVALCMTFGMYGMFMLASLDFQDDRGASPIVAGLELLPLPAVFVVLSPLAGRLVNRVGPRLPMTAGMALMGSGLLTYAVSGGDGPLPLTEIAFVITGAGLALNTGPVVGVAVSAVAPRLAGLASGLANLARMLGAALGVAVQGTALAVAGHGATHGTNFTAGLRAALLVGCAAELAGAAVALLKVRNPPPLVARREGSGNTMAKRGVTPYTASAGGPKTVERSSVNHARRRQLNSSSDGPESFG
jgi:MFS transporter, DHA2 family, methylenomycin A resistance protein